MKPRKLIFLLICSLLATIGCTQATEDQQLNSQKMEVAIIMFDDYETLDVFGPAEIFGRLVDQYSLTFYSEGGGIVSNRHGVPIMTERIEELTDQPDILLIPGGLGTRKEVNNTAFIEQIRSLALSSRYVLTVCTGSALLAKTGLLDQREATSNKRAFSWVRTQGADVKWDDRARWKVDGKYYTSSGVSAGMDMSFGFLADRHGIEFARTIAKQIEYNWVEDKDNDTFTAQ